MAANLHISLSAEPIAYLGNFPVTNSIFTSLIVSAFLILMALYVRSQLKDTDKPTGIQNVFEWIIESLFGLIHSITNDKKKTLKFFPVATTFFLFILLNNWLGLIPGVGPITVPEAHLEQAHEPETATIALNASAAEELYVTTDPEAVTESVAHTKGDPASDVEAGHAKNVPLFRPGTADLNTTIALALISMFLVQYFGVQHLNLAYFKKFINFESPILFFVGFLEIVSEFSKIISFAFRLFGNIFAGEVLLVVISSLASVIVPMPFYGLEIFVGFIQALVFCMLSVVFFNMATQGHESH